MLHLVFGRLFEPTSAEKTLKTLKKQKFEQISEFWQSNFAGKTLKISSSHKKVTINHIMKLIKLSCGNSENSHSNCSKPTFNISSCYSTNTPIEFHFLFCKSNITFGPAPNLKQFFPLSVYPLRWMHLVFFFCIFLNFGILAFATKN